MAIIGSLVKQPREKGPVDIDYSEAIDGRAVDSITTTIEVPSGMVKTSHAFEGNVLQIWIEGGSDNMAYRWVVLTSITFGGKVAVFEDEFDVVVEEVPNVPG